MPWVGVVLIFSVLLVLSFQRTVRRVATSIATLRTLATRTEVLQRPAGPGDRLPPAEQAMIDACLDTLTGLGARRLGDFVEMQAGGAPAGIVHWFVTNPPTTCGWVAIAGRAKRVPLVLFLSHSAGGHHLLTRRGAANVGHLAGPPTVHRLTVGGQLPIAHALARHQQELTRIGASPLLPIDDIAAALKLRDDVRDAQRAWRQRQPPEALLDADVRTMLPGAAAILVPWVRRRLQENR